MNQQIRPSSNDISQTDNASWSQVKDKLDTARRNWRWVETGTVFLKGMTIMLVLMLIALLLDNRLPLPQPIRIAAVILFAGTAAYLTVVRSLREWFRPLTDEMVARHVERRYDQLDNRFINAVQLHEEGFNDAIARKMAESQLNDAANAITQCDMGRSTNTRPVRRWGKRLFLLGLLLGIYAAVFSTHFSNAVMRYAQPHRHIAPVSSTQLHIRPGDATCLQGDSVRVRAQPEGVLPENATLLITDTDGETSDCEMTFEGRGFHYELDNLQDDIRYRVQAGDTVSRPHSITVRTRPRVTNLRLHFDYPVHTKLADHSETESSGDIRAVEGTEVTLTLKANRKLDSGGINITPLARPSDDATASSPSDQTIPMTRTKNRTWQGQFRITRSATYTIDIKDKHNIPNISAQHQIWAQTDQPPEVTILGPPDEAEVSPEGSVTILARATDDYSLHSMTLRVRQNNGNWKDMRSWTYENRTADQREGALLDLEELHARPGDTLSYYFQARDGHPDRSDSAGKSEIRQIQIRSSQDVASSDDDNDGGKEGSEQSQEEVAETDTDSEKQDDPDSRDESLMSERDRMERMLKKAEQFAEEQRDNLKTTRQLADKRVDEFSSEDDEKLQKVRDEQLKWAKYFQEEANDLSDLPDQDYGLGSMAEEHMEVYSEVQAAADALDEKSMEIATSAEESATAQAEEITENIEKWLSDKADQTAWKMEAHDDELDVPLTDLPEQLEDIIGELMAEEEELMEQAEDANANTLGSFDEGIGWDAMDGPIANMSAKGVTGNRLPNDNEMGGRSGEGRTGKSSGQFVEETATGKGGRRTPTRKTSDPYEEGTVKDTSSEPPTGATGGGKASGFGREGFQGQTPDTANRLKRLARQQKQLIGKARRIAHGLRKRRYPSGKLPETIKIMEDLHEELDSGRYMRTAARKKQVVLDNLHELKTVTEKTKQMRQDRSSQLPEQMREEVDAALRAPIPDKYEGTVRNYFETLSK